MPAIRRVAGVLAARAQVGPTSPSVMVTVRVAPMADATLQFENPLTSVTTGDAGTVANPVPKVTTI